LNFAIDTNRYVDFMRGVPEALTRFRSATEISVPLVVLAELRAGFLSGSKGAANEKNLARFLGRDGIRVLVPDEATTHLYARVFAGLRGKGAPIPTKDVWISALAIQHGLPLYTRDRHFLLVDGLAVL
jgi:tRNA(fMet)-specific endonuclease VapC